jgi:hypothetical protein
MCILRLDVHPSLLPYQKIPFFRSGIAANSIVAVDRAAHKDWKGAGIAAVGAVSAGLGK